MRMTAPLLTPCKTARDREERESEVVCVCVCNSSIEWIMQASADLVSALVCAGVEAACKEMCQ